MRPATTTLFWLSKIIKLKERSILRHFLRFLPTFYKNSEMRPISLFVQSHFGSGFQNRIRKGSFLGGNVIWVTATRGHSPKWQRFMQKISQPPSV